MRHVPRMLVLTLGLLVGSTGVALGDYLAYARTDDGLVPLPESLDPILTRRPGDLLGLQWGEYAGPQIRIGVLAVDNESRAASFAMHGPDGEIYAYSVSDYGTHVPVNGIDALVSEALLASGRVEIVERVALDEVLDEQDLGASGRVDRGTAAATGQVRGAQYLIKVVVTHYEPDVKGGEIDLGGLSRRLDLIGGLSVGRSKSVVGMNFRLLDATTSEVAFSRTIQVTMKETTLGLGGAGYGRHGILAGAFSGYARTPIGQAVIAAVNAGAYELVKRLRPGPIEGLVVATTDGQVVLNLGAGRVHEGLALDVYSRGEAFTDPATGEVLGRSDERIGSLRVARVEERLSYADPVGLDVASIHRGDRVVGEPASAPEPRFAARYDRRGRR